MNSKRLIFIFISLILLMHIPLLAADLATDIGEGNADSIIDIGDSTKWTNLSQNWKQTLLGTSLFSGVDSFFKKINPFFLVLFGDSYSFSLFFFFVFILWLWFLFQFGGVLKLAIFSKWVALAISFGLTVALAQLGLYSMLSNLFVKIIFLPKKPWVGIIFFFLILFLLVIFAKIRTIIEVKVGKNKAILEKEKEKIDRKILGAYTRGLSEN